jgi:Protein of unknown function (DUF5132)
MPTIDNLLKNETAKGVAIGLGAALVGVAAIPTVIMVGRPLARIAIKSGLLFLEKGREAMAEATESLEDLVAEVKSELVPSAHEESVFSAEATDLSDSQEG